MTGVKCNITSAYHPQSKGQDERFNQTLQRQLLKFVSEEQNDWDLYLDSIAFSYRVSRQDSTKASPFYLVYGRQARLPIELNIKPEEGEPAAEPSTSSDLKFDEYISDMIKIRRRALENIQAAQERQKGYYDAKHGKDKSKYQVGELVLVKNSKKLSRKGSKMEPNWHGHTEFMRSSERAHSNCAMWMTARKSWHKSSTWHDWSCIIFEHMNMQWQSGPDDCGLFAIATATSLCEGQDPVLYIYHQQQMRQHLLKALEIKALHSFPSRRTRQKKAQYKRERMQVYCKCRRPDDGRRMVQCSRCKEWYHMNCICISETLSSKDPWLCGHC